MQRTPKDSDARPNCRRRLEDSINRLGPCIFVVLLIGANLACGSSREAGQTFKATPGITQPSPTASEKPGTNMDADKTSILETVRSFYIKYDSCVKNPPAEATGRVGEYCQNNSGLTTATFANNLEKGGTAKAGADPIFCAQNIPEGVTVATDTQTAGNRASTSVSEKFGSTQVKIQVELLKENTIWKVDNLVCPKP